MAEVAILVGAFGELRAWLVNMQTRRAALAEVERNAVRALQLAVDGTSRYLGSIERGDLRIDAGGRIGHALVGCCLRLLRRKRQSCPIATAPGRFVGRPQQWMDEAA